MLYIKYDTHHIRFSDFIIDNPKRTEKNVCMIFFCKFINIYIVLYFFCKPVGNQVSFALIVNALKHYIFT